MPIETRQALYARIESLRNRPIITYVTSNRQNAEGIMAPDSIPEILDQLLLIPATHREIDLLIVSNGGDPTVSWRIMTLLRDRFDRVCVLIPQAAFSAATLLALGADEIVMHPCANLGPVDPQIRANRPKQVGAEPEMIHFGSEDLAGFLRYVRNSVGLSDQEHLFSAFELFCKEAGAVPIGVATRAAELSVSMGQKLLRMHMKGESDGNTAKGIAETLNKNFFHHGYPVGRKEAKEIGLKVVEPATDLEELMWSIWLDLESEMRCRDPFNPVCEIGRSAISNLIFAPVPQVSIPSGLPPNILDQVTQQILQQTTITNLDGVDFETKHAIIESPRRVSMSVTRGKLFARRESDLRISLNKVPFFSGWQNFPITPIQHS